MITINIDKAKGVAHNKRRAVRAAEFAPLDVQATVPALAVAAEEQRQAIRDKHAVIQDQIEAATDVDTLKAIVEGL